MTPHHLVEIWVRQTCS